MMPCYDSIADLPGKNNEEDHAGSSWEDEELDDWDEMGGEDEHEDLWAVEEDEDEDDDLAGENEDY